MTSGGEGRYWHRIQRTFDAIAEEFDRSRQRPWEEVVAFLGKLPPRARLLDVGCGNGRHMIPHAQAGGGAVGVDLSPGLLAAAKRNLAGHRGWSLVLALASRLPFPSNVFDAVVCIATLHHIPSDRERLAALVEVRRVLRRGGTGLLSCWALEQRRFSHLDSQDVEVPWTLSDGSRVMRFYHLFRKGELETLSERAGLTIGRSFRSGDNYFVKVSDGG